MKHKEHKKAKKHKFHKCKKKYKEDPQYKEHHRKHLHNTVSEWENGWLFEESIASPVSDSDMIRIYEDLTKLSLVERYLKILYRPFTCSAQTGCQYRLAEVDCFLPESIYEPDKHPALFLRLSNPSCSLRVYDNGMMSCQGFSYESAALGIHRCIDTMEQLGFKPIFQTPCFNVVNATFCMPFGINLIEICLEYSDSCIYSHEADPYLIFQLQNSSIKLAIFSIGFVFVLLSSQMRYTQKAIAFIMPILIRHRQPGKRIPRYRHADLSSGDVTFKLLWENEFQTTYQDSLQYFRYPNEC